MLNSKQDSKDPDIFSSPEYPKLARRKSQLEDTIKLFDLKKSILKQIEENKEISDSDDAELSNLLGLK